MSPYSHTKFVSIAFILSVTFCIIQVDVAELASPEHQQVQVDLRGGRDAKRAGADVHLQGLGSHLVRVGHGAHGFSVFSQVKILSKKYART